MTAQVERYPHGLDEALIAQSEQIEPGLDESGSSKDWIGASLPWVELPVCPGPASTMNLALMADLFRLILCVYSKLETVRAIRWGQRAGELEREGYRIIALSAETLKTHQEWASRAKLAYPVVSDSELQLARLLGLPTLETGEGIREYEDLTLVTNGTIAEVFYPLEHPNDDDAARVMSRIRRVDVDR